MIDYISAGLLIIGYIITGKKNKWGWLFAAFGNLGYIFVAIKINLYGMMVLSIIMLCISIYNFIKWHKENGVELHRK